VSDLHDSPRAAFDDDRLLDYALGIEDDPELAAALSRSARLRERLADLKADLAAIETELRHAIPAPDDSYADPSAARWPRLARALGLSGSATAGRRPLRRRRLAVALLAAALALALLIGVLSVLPRGGSSSSSSGSSKSADALQAPLAGAAAAPASQSAGAHAPAATAAGTAGATGSPATVTALHAADFRDVAVVRAGTLIGADQSFSAVRTLKGRPPASFSLTLLSADSAPAAGSLAIAYLRPLATPSSSASANPLNYSFNGQLALLAALPAGVPASAVRLP
jgi:hypothetical protein